MQARRQHGMVATGDAPGHRNRLPACGGAVIHRRIGDVGAEKARNLRLKLEQDLQGALRDFGLIRGVGGKEFAALNEMIDARRDMMAIRPCPQEERRIGRRQVLRGEVAHCLLYTSPSPRDRG